MKRSHSLGWLFVVLCLLTLILLAYPTATASAERSGIQAAWQRARQAGSYCFIADIRQTVAPKPTVLNVGRTSKEQAFHLEGETNLPDRQLHLTLWSQGGSVLDASSGVEVRVDGDRAYARQGLQDWEEINNFTGLFAPQGDFMAYLAATRDVANRGTETRSFPSWGRAGGGTEGVTFTRYTFRIDGRGYAHYLRNQLERHLAEQGELPRGVSLDLPRQYVDMTGEGELWVGTDGFPWRQILHLRFPPRPDDREISVEVTVDFSDFEQTPASRVTNYESRITNHESRITDCALRITLALAFCAALIVHRRSRTLYIAVALVVVTSMVVTPLLQSVHAARFAEKQAARAREAEDREQESDMQQVLRRFMTEPDWNPNADPLATRLRRDQSSRQRVSESANYGLAASGNGSDSDSTTECDADDTGDNDGDGLTNGAECALGTDPDWEDTDNDSVTDGEEVTGFEYDSKMWYTDPLEMDTNRDGLGDGIEWNTGRQEGEIQPDMDDDGTPDLFDRDNDSDSVPDDVDLSPYFAGDITYTAGAPFQLVLDNLTEGIPTFVEFQLRPTDPDHLWYAFNVLDWPDDDRRGQIQDADGKTFYDVDDSLSLSPNDNGDVKLIPMLEIKITGEPTNLPPQEDLENYGVIVQDLTDDGRDKAAYVPLKLVVDSPGDERVAFAGQMLYLPADSWGNAHQVRLVWVVQALVDVCQEYQDGRCVAYEEMNDVQIIHSYDDDWTLTGLDVREEHGTHYAITYEDPDVDTDWHNDAPLTYLAYGLDRSFLAGSDCEEWDDKGTDDTGDDECVSSDGKPDITIAEIYRRWNRETNSGVTVTETWGISDTLSVITRTYATMDEAVMTVAVTETRQVLDDYFTPYWTESEPISPTLLFACEHRFRGLNLDANRIGASTIAWSEDNRSLTLDLEPDDVQVQTMAGLNWAPYKYQDGEWAACPIEDYWPELQKRYEEQFREEFSDEPNPEEVRGGAVTLMQIYYVSLYHGVNAVVQIGESLKQQLSWSLDSPLWAAISNAGRKGGLFIIENTLVETGVLKALHRLRTTGSQVWTRSVARQFIKQTCKRWLGKAFAKVKLGLAILGMIATITAILVNALYLSKTRTGNKGLRIGLAVSIGLILFASSIVMPILQSIHKIKSVIAAGTTAAKATRQTLLKPASGAALKLWFASLIIAVGITWGVFIHTVCSRGITPGSVAFSMLLAQTIASTIATVLLFVIALNAIGSIIVSIIILIDTILMLLGVKWSISGWIAEVASNILVGFEVSVETDVDLGAFDMSLVHPEGGFVDGADLEFASTVTTTVTHKDPEKIRTEFAVRTGAYDEDQLRRSAFEYALASSHTSPLCWSGEETWQDVRTHHDWKGHSLFTGWKADDVATSGIFLIAGINRAHTVPLRLITDFSLPGMECWWVVILPICVQKDVGGRTSTDLGQTLTLDVLPQTLDEFVDVVEWADGLRIRDADGDGLLSVSFNGSDPDDTTWDADGDGLSDAWEMEMSARPADEGGAFFDPRMPDTDEDGLPDGDEARAGTNPNHWDSDGDTISDASEVLDGWEFTYWQDASLRIYSDPIDPDWDGDGMDDLFERTLHTCPDCDPLENRYHPYVWNNSPIGLYTEVGDEDGVLSAGQTFPYTTTAQNNLKPDLWVRGDTALPAGPLTGGPLDMHFDLPREESQSLYSYLTAPGDATTQDVDLITEMDAQLHTPSVWAWDPEQSGSRETATGAEPQAVAVTPVDGWTVPYVVAALENGSVYVYPTAADGFASNSILVFGGGEQNNVPLDIACNNEGTCLIITAKPWGDKDIFQWQLVLPDGQLGQGGNLHPASGEQIYGGSVASDGAGFLVVWVWGTASSRSLWARHFDADGTVNFSTMLDSGALGDDTDLTWSYDRFQVVWSRDGDIYAAEVSIDDGSDDVDQYLIADGRLSHPHITYDALSHRSLAVYRRLDGSDHLLRGHILAGGHAGDEINLTTFAKITDPVGLSVSADPINGGWVVAWTQGEGTEIAYQAVGMDGGLRGNRQVVNPAGDSTTALDVACARPRPSAQLLFDEESGATTFADSSGFGNDGTCEGSACPTAGTGGKDGNAVQFDGEDDVVTVMLDVSEEAYGLTLWFKTTCQDCGLCQVGTGDTGHDRHLYLKRGNVCARVWKNETLCSSGTNYADGNWHQVAHTFGGGVGGQRIYVDGELQTSGNKAQSDFDWQDRVHIGCSNDAQSRYLDGTIDEVTIYPRSLSEGEVRDRYRAALVIYPLDEVEGATTFVNAAHNGYTGECSGNSCPTAGVGGKAYAAAQFDGGDDTIVVANQPRAVAVYSYTFESGVGSEWSHSSRETTLVGARTFLGRFGNDKVTLDLSNLPTHDQVEITFDLYVIETWDGNKTINDDGPDYWEWWTDDTRQLRTTFSNYDPPYNYQFYPDEPWSPSGVTVYGRQTGSGAYRTWFFDTDDPDIGPPYIADVETITPDSDTAAWFYWHTNYGGSSMGCDGKMGPCDITQSTVGSVRVWAAANDWREFADEVNTLGYDPDSVYRISQTFDHIEDSLQLKFAGSNLEGLSNESWGLDNVEVRVNSHNVPLANSSFTAAFWAKRNGVDSFDCALGQGTRSQDQGLHLGFRENGEFTCAFFGDDLDAPASYYDTADWHHWACTYDADTNERTIYRDGEQVAQDTASADYQGSGTLRIGQAPGDRHFFDGRLDELAVWNQALSASEIERLYEKVKVLDDSVIECALPRAVQGESDLFVNRLALRETTTLLGTSHQETEDKVTIDTDPPTSTITSLSDGQFLAVTGTLVIGGDAQDNTSVAQVEVSVDGGAWQEAEGVESWAFEWDTSGLDEGAHTVRSRATDVADNQETPEVITVIIDRTPPQVTGDPPPQRATLGVEANWVVKLSGAVSDPDAGAEPGSGVQAVMVLLEGQGQVAGAGWQMGTLEADGTWWLHYALPDFGNDEQAIPEPTGVYTLNLRPVDNVDNAGLEIIESPLVQLDNTAPVADLRYTGPVTTVITDTAIMLSGVITDPGAAAYGVAGLEIAFRRAEQVGIYEGAVLYLKMDDPDPGLLVARRVFRDSSGYNHHGRCGDYDTCPSAGIGGRVDSAASFDGDEAQPDVLAVDPSDHLNLGTGEGHFTLAAWIQAHHPEQGNRKYGVLGYEYDDGGRTPWLGLYHKYNGSDHYRVRAGFTDAGGTAWEIESGEDGHLYHWTHIAVTYNGEDLVMYINGNKEAQVTVPAGTKPLDREMQFNVGAKLVDAGDPGYITHHPFDGFLDEVMVYNRALDGVEAKALYDSASLTWDQATLEASGAGIITTTWAYSVPADMEGYYEIALRGTDVVGNRNDAPQAQSGWVGEIDTQSPRNDPYYEADGPWWLGPTYYVCDVEDMNLDEESLEGCPCPAGNWQRTHYHQVSDWYRKTTTDTLRLYRIQAYCVLNEPTPPTYSNTVCDFYGRCTTETRSIWGQTATPALLPTATPSLYSAVYTPTNGAVLTTIPFNVEGIAYAHAYLQTLDVTVNSTPLYATGWPAPPLPGAVTETLWSTVYAPPGEGQYTFLSAVTDWASTVPTTTYPTTVTVDLLPPAPPTFDTLVITTAHRAGQGVAILAGGAADTIGVQRVEVNPDNTGWGDASLSGDTINPDWRFLWPIGQSDPDGVTYDVTARTTDFGGHTNETTVPVLFDMQPPAPVTVTLGYFDAFLTHHSVAPGETVRDGNLLVVEWTPSDDGSGVLGYWVGWTTSPTDTTGTLFVPAGTVYSYTQLFAEAQAVYAHVVAVDLVGNRRQRTLGPIYVDAPLTPDITDLDYHGWMESGCTQMGLSRRIPDHAPAGASLSEEQQFYATWDTNALRLAWTGANWYAEGDLFVYLDTQPGGAMQLYNPYTGTLTDTTIYLPGNFPPPDTSEWPEFEVVRQFQMITPLLGLTMQADYLVWVEDSDTATLLSWNGSAWVTDTVLSDGHYRLSYGRIDDAPLHITDLYLPFSLLGIGDPVNATLALLAAASEEDALRLWSVMPERNPVNGAQAVNPLAGVATEHVFALTHAYFWLSLGPGLCPYTLAWLEPPAEMGFVDADLRADLTVEPLGTTYALFDDDLFWQWQTLFQAPGPRSEGFTFLDHSHPPLGQGSVVTYALRVSNHGASPATDVKAFVSAYYALSLDGGTQDPTGYREYRILDVGTVAPGAVVTTTFTGVVEVEANWRYDRCLNVAGLPEETCRLLLEWATLDGLIFDARSVLSLTLGVPTQLPLEWVWADHAVDVDPPEFVGIDAPRFAVWPTATTVRGYGSDPSGVVLVEVEVRNSLGVTTTLTCPDGTPYDGRWACEWGVDGDDGDTFDLRARATDGFGHVSDWMTLWRTLVVDTTPPTVTLDADARAAVDGQLVGPAGFLLTGVISDNHSGGAVEVCGEVDGETLCEPATALVTTQAPTGTASVYDDVPAAPIALDSATYCGGGEITRTFSIMDEFIVGDVDLGLNATHPYREDIVVELVSPAGTHARVIAPSGTAYGFENYDVWLNDAASQPLHDNTDDDPAEPYYNREAQPYEPLSAFEGESSNGVWELRICDLNPLRGDGAYNRSQLSLTPQGAALSTAGTWSYPLPILEDADGLTQALTIYGADGVGNRTSVPISLTYRLDVVAPVLTVTVAVSQMALESPRPVLVGKVSEGNELDVVYVCVEPPDGAYYCELARMETLYRVYLPLIMKGSASGLNLKVRADSSSDGSVENWYYIPRSDVGGAYTFWIEAYDAAGNVTQVGPYEVQVGAQNRLYLPLVMRNSP